MAGWDGWATFFMGVNPPPTAAVVYGPKDGAVWGKSGDIPLDGGCTLKSLDQKADGGEVSVKKGGKPIMFIKKTDEDCPISVFKMGSDSLVTMAGPSDSRVAVYIENGKPEPYMAALDKVKKAAGQNF